MSAWILGRRLKAAWRAFRHPMGGTDGEAVASHSLHDLLAEVPALMYTRHLHSPAAFAYVGGSVRELLGYDGDTIVADPDFWLERVHGEDRERCLGTLAALGPGQPRMEFEYRYRARDGSWRWLRDECRMICDGAGQPRQIVGSCLEVTDRHRSEQALARSEEQLRAAQARLMDALESSDDAFSVFDCEDRLVAFNSRYRQIYPTIADLVRPGVAFVDLLRASAQRSQYLGVSPDQVEAWVEERLAHHRHPAEHFEQHLSDGRCLEIVERPTAEGGRVAIRRDISHRKVIEDALRAELRFKQTLMEALPIPVYYKSRDGIYLGCNRAFLDALGKTPEQIIGKRMEDIYPPDKVAEYRERDAELFARGGTQSFETTYRLQDGVHHQMSVVRRTFPGSDGAVAGLIGTAIDLTAQKRMEEQMVRNARLVTVGQIASEVAHEMNQPLSIVRMTAESVLGRLHQADMPPQALADKLSVVLEQSERMGEMIGHLRSFSVSDQGTSHPFSPLAAIAAAIDMVALPFRLDDIALALDLPPSCPEIVGQDNQLEQLLLNLLTNARDAVRAHRPIGDRRVSVQLQAEPESLLLRIEDNGGGIDEQVWPRIFTPFFTAKAGGTGLGLSICANIAAALGGRIDGRNGPLGAVFEVRLPLAGRTLEPLPAAAPAAAASEAQRILVVDDEPLAVDCIADYLQQQGYEVISALSPLEALDLASQHPIHLVLSDQRMPGMDGSVLIRRLRQIRPGLPAVLMSGGSIPLPPAEEGPSARLSKPLHLDELGQTLAGLLEGASATPPAAGGAEEKIPAAAATSGSPAERLWLLGEVTATLAHDVGQPLNIIRLNAESALDLLAEHPALADRLRRAFGATIEQCQRIHDLTQALLAATRRPQLPPQPLPPAIMLRDALAGIQDRVRMQAIAFSWHGSPKLPKVMGHAPRLRAALGHLLERACDALAIEALVRHGRQPGWRARLDVRCERQGQGAIRIRIADNGSSPASEEAGELGLAIARGVIAEMNGRLDFLADAGNETVIVLPLPPRRLFLPLPAPALATALAAEGWQAGDTATAEIALLVAPAAAVPDHLALLARQAPDLPVLVVSDLSESDARAAVAAGAAIIFPSTADAADINEFLEENLPG